MALMYGLSVLAVWVKVSPDAPDLTLIDLPGIVRTATQGQVRPSTSTYTSALFSPHHPCRTLSDVDARACVYAEKAFRKRRLPLTFIIYSELNTLHEANSRFPF
jgi:hypothetical protein